MRVLLLSFLDFLVRHEYAQPFLQVRVFLFQIRLAFFRAILLCGRFVLQVYEFLLHDDALHLLLPEEFVYLLFLLLRLCFEILLLLKEVVFELRILLNFFVVAQSFCEGYILRLLPHPATPRAQ